MFNSIQSDNKNIFFINYGIKGFEGKKYVKIDNAILIHRNGLLRVGESCA